TFLPAERIRDIACVEITQPDVFDDLGEVLRNGLHDPRMGCFKDKRDEPCGTCKLTLDQGCVGHFGRVRLVEPVFNPFMFGPLVKLLKESCRYCNKLRMHESEKQNILQKFKLLAYGLLPPDRVYDKKDVVCEEVSASLAAGSSSSSSSSKKKDAKKSSSSTSMELFTHSSRQEVWEAKSSEEHRDAARRLKEEIAVTDKKEHKQAEKLVETLTREIGRVQGTVEFNQTLLEEYRKLFKYFEQNQPMKKCANCGHPSDIWRKDGASRLFVKARGGGHHNASAVAMDEEGGAQAAAGGANDMIVFPRKCQQILRQLWEGEDHELLKFLYPGSRERRFARPHDNDKENRELDDGPGSSEMFFLQELLVTPNQFRAPRKSETSADSFQLDHETKCLKEILVACEDLRKIGRDLSGNKLEDAKKDEKQQLALENDQDAAADKLAKAVDVQVIAGSELMQKKEDSVIAKAFISLQEKVNVYMDSSKGATKAEQDTKGIRQKIERKQGLFRMKMMGKRVNFAGRSVISPEPNVETNEIGVPLFMCKVLGVPERVWEGNVAHMEQLVMNGNDVYPGASQLFVPASGSGTTSGSSTAPGAPRYDVIDLKSCNEEMRINYASQLKQQSHSERPYIVYRNLVDGDPVLMNRQPTLHKPGIMCQVVKVLKKENTLRFHYANCNTYNADFDGDEMNMHAPQDVQGRLEALKIAEADRQYVVPTSGKPLRGIIQDHIAGAVLMMARDTFFDKHEVAQLLYRGLRSQMEQRKSSHWVKMPDLNLLVKGMTQAYENQACEVLGTKSKARVKWPVAKNVYKKLVFDPPAIMRPVPKWTGKQVFSILLKNLIIIHNGKQNVFHTNKPKTPGDMWNGVFDGTCNKEEGQIIIRNSELLTGVLDKSEFGASAGGLTHLCYEIFGPKMAGAVLSTYARVFTAYLQMRGFTCAMIDTLVEKPAERKRRSMIDDTMDKGFGVIDRFIEDHEGVVPEEKVLHVESLENTLGRSLWKAFSKSLDDAEAQANVNGNGGGDNDMDVDDEASPEEENDSSDDEDEEEEDSDEDEGSRSRKKRKVGSPTKASASKPASETTARRKSIACGVVGEYTPKRRDSSATSSAASSSKTSAKKSKEEEPRSFASYLAKDDFVYATLRHFDSVPTTRQLRLKQILSEDPVLVDKIEGQVMALTNQDWGKTIDTVLPAGQRLKFPHNCFATMVYTGAKGSKINHSQIGCLLGQQCLEGRRVPLLPTMRTLPSFAPYDLAVRAGGYVSDRFLTGLRPQEFYFHCMAGREGLVDTTVKTARSGYLQRCLVKHLETCVVAYDGTVRDVSDGSIVQFLYGEDGVDVTKSAFLEKFKQLRENLCSDLGRERTQRRMARLRRGGVVDTTLAREHMDIRDMVKDMKPKTYRDVSDPNVKNRCVVGYDVKEAVGRLETLRTTHEKPRFGEEDPAKRVAELLAEAQQADDATSGDDKKERKKKKKKQAAA
ncbi:unnamed protein product, partial [Amoebophrya sp. A25]